MTNSSPLERPAKNIRQDIAERLERYTDLPDKSIALAIDQTMIALGISEDLYPVIVTNSRMEDELDTVSEESALESRSDTFNEVFDALEELSNDYSNDELFYAIGKKLRILENRR